MDRKTISEEQVDDAYELAKEHTREVIKKKGNHTYSSIHEMLGILTEEQYELTDAVHKNDLKLIRKELFDILTGCVFGIACIDANTVEW